ncbi:helix-turn-helix transcriptional regulator [Oscillospiraceae bacterium 38-13]
MFKRRIPTQVQRECFGRAVHDARIRCGLSQEKLAEVLECSPHWINNVERGKSNLNWKDTIHLLSILKIDPEELTKEVKRSGTVSAGRK